MHRGMSNSHIRCATILMVATAPRLCTPDVRQKPFSIKNKTFTTRQHKRSIKAQSWHIYLTNDLILTNSLDPNCELQKPLYETTNWQTPYLLDARKNGRRKKSYRYNKQNNVQSALAKAHWMLRYLMWNAHTQHVRMRLTGCEIRPSSCVFQNQIQLTIFWHLSYMNERTHVTHWHQNLLIPRNNGKSQCVQFDNHPAILDCGTCESHPRTSDNRKTGTYIQTHALPLNKSDSSKHSFQIAHERMAQTDRNHIDVNRTDALHLVTLIIAKGLLENHTPMSCKQSSDHTHNNQTTITPSTRNRHCCVWNGFNGTRAWITENNGTNVTCQTWENLGNFRR